MDNKNRMLIDASHPEETRVVVLRGDRVEEFDYESALRKQLRGNIYLAKVTRVEPSLQAAFVDYGGNRHGFLAFSEIHPDYYQIPVADREALLKEEAEEEKAASAAEDDEADARGRGKGRGRRRRAAAARSDEDATLAEAPAAGEAGAEGAADDLDVIEMAGGAVDERDLAPDAGEEDGAADTGAQGAEALACDEAEEADEAEDEASELDLSDAPRPMGLVEDLGVEEVNGGNGDGEQGEGEGEPNGGAVEQVGSEDALEEVPQRTRRRHRFYKIQEVIKRRQIVLVQVVKEERGNKGAALTTYLSLAGRYTVLMPNTARGGGISRKITNPADRKRLRKIAAELDVPAGMGLIIRTAGASRTKAEIKRDFEYLLRLWENVRDLTLESTAPTLVYEEGDLIKRSIRDLYSKDIEEVLVAGEEAYKEAKDFMRMLMPSHAKNVKLYREAEPLFTKFQIERQLNAMFSPVVTLRSGGYLVINQTEALVAIDVNSGKATREHSIEETALQTNLEAAEEIARQLKLRDLAGLIVVDFIDMDERRNNRAVERRLKDCLRHDRARIQVGRISHFGLLEMSRQRLRTGVLEGSTSPCPHCQGTGLIRSTESVALSVLRALEEALIAGERCDLTAITSVDVSLYILNHKRPYIKDIEARYGVSITVTANDRLQGANFSIEKTMHGGAESEKAVVVNLDWVFPTLDGKGEDGKKRKQRRRRKRRTRSESEASAGTAAEAAASGESEEERLDAGEGDGQPAEAGGPEEEGKTRKPRRRGRRGGRRTRRSEATGEAAPPPDEIAASEEGPEAPADTGTEGSEDAAMLSGEGEGDAAAGRDGEEGERPRRRRSRSRSRTRPAAGQRGNGRTDAFPGSGEAEGAPGPETDGERDPEPESDLPPSSASAPKEAMQSEQDTSDPGERQAVDEPAAGEAHDDNPHGSRRQPAPASEAGGAEAHADAESEPGAAAEKEEAARPRQRRGWWQRG